VTINWVFEVDYAVFAVFATLLITEIMGAMLLLTAWDATKKRVLDYIVPIWEITGTFGAFWVVTSYFAYPTLLIPVSEIFAPLLIIFLILFIARNSSIAFAEFIIKKRWLDEVKLYKAYAFSAIVLGLVLLVLVSALVGGQGVHLSIDLQTGAITGSFSIASWATAGSVIFILGTLLLGAGLAPAFFDLAPLRRLILPLTGAGIALSVLSYYLMSSTLLTWWMTIPVVLTLAAGLLYLWPKTTRILANKAVFILLMCIAVFSLQPLVYPNVIGRAYAVDNLTTSGTMESAFLPASVVGAIVLAVMIGFYVMVAARGTSGPDTPISTP
jgi:cytochrome d ubiquinol oxidase subunit II